MSMSEFFLIMGKFLLPRATNLFEYMLTRCFFQQNNLGFEYVLTRCDPKAALPTFYDKSPLDTAVEHYFMKYHHISTAGALIVITV